MKNIYVLLAGIFILVLTGCATNVVEDIDGNVTTTKVTPNAGALLGVSPPTVTTTTVKNQVRSLNLDMYKLIKLRGDLVGLDKNVVNDYGGGKVYVREFDKNGSLCFASFSSDNLDSLKLMLSSGKGMVQPAYREKNDFVDLSPDFDITAKLIAGFNNVGFDLHKAEKSVEYDVIFRKKLIEAIDEETEKKGESTVSVVITGLFNSQSLVEKPYAFSLYDSVLINALSDKIGKFDYFVIPNSAMPPIVTYIARRMNYYKYSNIEKYLSNGEVKKYKASDFIDTKYLMPMSRSVLSPGIVLVASDILTNMDISPSPHKLMGLYRESLLSVGCLDNEVESIVETIKDLKNELQLSGTLKSKALGY